MPRSTKLTCLLIFAAVLLAAPVAAGAQERPALLRVVHFGLGAPAVDVTVDGTATGSALAFKGAAKYIETDAGAHQVVLRPAGSGQGGAPVASASVTLRAGRPYTLALLGKPGKFETSLVSDDFTLPPAGMARIRLLNANPDSPGVDVATPGGVVLVRDCRYKQASPYVTVPAGQPFAGDILQTGTSKVLLTTQGSEPLPAGAVITVVGARTPTGVETLSILDAAGSGSLPRGGIATGAGGTTGGAVPWGVWLVSGALLLLMVGLRGRAWANSRRR